MSSKPRIAFVLDALPSLGGAEKVMFTALEMYPQAEIFTLIYNKPVFAETPIARRTIHTSYLNSLPLARNYHRFFLPLMPHAVEQLDLRGYDVIVSFNYAVAHGIHNPDGALHLAYTYTPMRYAWTDLNLDGTPSRQNWLVRRFMDSFRQWDRRAASHVHAFAAISRTVEKRIQNAWGRDSHLIYPPVDIERFSHFRARGDTFVTVTRLVPHKRIDLIVQAFSRLGLPLVVIGDGPEMPRLKAMAAENIQLMGYVSDSKTAEIIGAARAFVCAAEEDFGIAIVEAQAAGCPVITYGQGGALESVVEGVTGLFFEEQSVDSLINAIQRFESCAASFCREELVRNANRFGKARFLREFRHFVEGSS